MNMIIRHPAQADSSAAVKFSDPQVTLTGQRRASVTPRTLQTLWLNTGTLCNLSCDHCYIESSPSNDRLVYLRRAEVQTYLREIDEHAMPVETIGITGGEPFMNPDILDILEDLLSAGMRVLVLTNAMRPMLKCADGLLALRQRFAEKLALRVSVDHYSQVQHEAERGRRSWQPMLAGLTWLAQQGFALQVAGRSWTGESAAALRQGFAQLFAQLELPLDAGNDEQLLLFPEMDAQADVAEISTDCWQILGVNPADMMCASSRMIIKRRGARAPEVVACTLLPYDSRFSLGATLLESMQPVALNHPHCARFCVLGGGSCAG